MDDIHYSSIAKVPSDLIPVNIHSITAEYAIKTYAYAHSIDKVMFPELVIRENTSNLPDWINRLRELQRSLQKLGYDEILKESIRVMNMYGCTMPNSNVPPTSFSDIMLIFSDKFWYNDDVTKKRTIIHMVCYGIYQKGWDHWLQGIEAKWLLDNNLQISQGTNQRRGTSFVHANLIALSTDSMTKPVQLHMKNAHGEYIQIRKKGEKSNTVFEVISLGPITAYLVKSTVNKCLYADKPCPIVEFKVYVEKLIKFKKVTMRDLTECLYGITDNQTSPLTQVGKFYCTSILIL